MNFIFPIKCIKTLISKSFTKMPVQTRAMYKFNNRQEPPELSKKQAEKRNAIAAKLIGKIACEDPSIIEKLERSDDYYSFNRALKLSLILNKHISKVVEQKLKSYFDSTKIKPTCIKDWTRIRGDLVCQEYDSFNAQVDSIFHKTK